MEFRHRPLIPNPGDKAIEEVLREIAVPFPVLEEAKRRRNLVCTLAKDHPAGLSTWNSGSLAHGTENSPLGDADAGVMVSYESTQFRSFGPESRAAKPGSPEEFIRSFAAFILPRVQEKYPLAQVDLEGNRAIKFLFNDQVDVDSLGQVDPHVDLIVGLNRRGAPGIWIPNRRTGGWDASNPQRHTEMMTAEGSEELRVHRAHLIRLGKRAIKREGKLVGSAAMCSWNFSALALKLVTARGPLAASLAGLLGESAREISKGLTPDPAGVAGPIPLPDGMTQQESARRLSQMAETVDSAAAAASRNEARRLLAPLFGHELDEIRRKEQERAAKIPINDALRRRDAAALGAALGAPGPEKIVRSHGGTSAQ